MGVLARPRSTMAESPLDCLPIQTANTPQLPVMSVVRVSSQLFVIFFLTVRKAVAAGAEETPSKVARRHALENSYDDVVRNLKG